MGVALFALALIWLIALMTHEPTDPVWFFTTEDASSPANFVGRVGAFLSEVSFQLFGYAAYLLPGAVGVVGWHYFWCQTPQAAYTKAFGATLLLACASAFFSLVLGTAELAATTFDAGGSVGAGLGTVLTDYLNRTGSIIVLLTTMMLSVILATQFSFGRMFETASSESRNLSMRGLGLVRGYVDRRRREKARREVIAKHTKKGGPPPEVPLRPAPADVAKDASRAAVKPADAPSGLRAVPPPVVQRKKVETPSLLPDPEPPKAPAQRKPGTFTLPPLALLDAPKVETEDRRAGADGSGPPARGQVR